MSDNCGGLLRCRGEWVTKSRRRICLPPFGALKTIQYKLLLTRYIVSAARAVAKRFHDRLGENGPSAIETTIIHLLAFHLLP